MKVYPEITPVKDDDVFVILNHKDADFDYPIHTHPEYELNLVINSLGSRIVGDSVLDYGPIDLVLIGPKIYHCWDNDKEKTSGTSAQVITIQFDENLFDEKFLSRDTLRPIKELLEFSIRGISFDGDTRDDIMVRMKKLSHMKGFKATLEFLDILHTLAVSKDKTYLASVGFSSMPEKTTYKRINVVYDYILEKFTDVDLNLTDVAKIVSMSDSAFSHFFKKCTNKSFTQFVVDLRIGYASKLLLETQDSVGQICYACGFNNVSNFNRLFKKNRSLTPKDYRKLFNKGSMLDHHNLTAAVKTQFSVEEEAVG